MKKLLLILVLLAIAVPVSAKGLVVVYNMKQNNSNIDWDDMSQQWTQTKDAYNSYVVVEHIIGSNTANVFSIDIWQEKDKSGQTTKYASAQSIGEMDLIEAPVGKKLMWIISFEDGNNRVMLTGEAKSAKIGTTPYTFASKFTGLSIWNQEDGSNRYIGSGKISLSLNAPYTKYAYDNAFTGEQAMNALLDHLVNDLGYTEVTP
jgi:hypothetical protein